MTSGNNEEKVTNVIDVFWDGFLNSIKTFQSFQNEVEVKSIEAFESQLEMFETAFEQLINIEDESKKINVEWKANLQEVLNNALTGYGVQNLKEWTDKLDEIEVEALAFSPSKKTFEALSESNEQLESTLLEAIGQREKNRAVVFDVISEYVDQLKQTQNNVLKTLNLNNPLIVK